MRIDIRPRRKNAPRPLEKSAPAFLQWLRGRPCHTCTRPTNRVEAAHVDHAGGKGVGTKVADRYAIPLCGGPDGCHATQHRLGWRTFERINDFDAVQSTELYWRAWPGRIAWERKLEDGR